MLSNSRQSQRGSSDDTIDIISLISDVDSASIELIGQQQHAQIDSLKAQVQSLENQLANRNEESLFVKKKISQISIAINQIVQLLLNSIDKEEQEKISILKKIKNEKNPYNKIDQYISFMKIYTQSNLESFNRICDQLRNHVELIELLNNGADFPLPISSQPDYRQILLDEARKTNEFIKNSLNSSSPQNSIIPPISEILNLNNFSSETRYDKVQTLIYDYDIPINELKALLLQEIAITDVLRKYISTNFSEQNIEAKFRPQIEKDIRNQVESRLRAEITKNLTEKVRIETENELRPKIEQELRFKIESEQQQYLERSKNDQKWKEEQHAQQIQELENEIERLKRSAKDDLISEINNDMDSELRKKIVSMLRGEIEADVRSQIRNENLINSKNDEETNQYTGNNYFYGNYKNDYQNYQESLQNIQNQQKQEYENRLQRELQTKEMQLRSQFDIELQQKENQIQKQLRTQFDLELQRKESQIKTQLRSQFNSEFEQKENQIKMQLQSQFDLDLQQKESQIRKQIRAQYDSELQQKENQIQERLRSKNDLDIQQKENQIRKQLSTQYDSELQQKENQIQERLRSKYDLDLQQKESQIRKQLSTQYDLELQQKENQIQERLRSKYDLDLQQKESQIRKQLSTQYDLELQQKEKQIRAALEPQIREEIMNELSPNSNEIRPNNNTNNLNAFERDFKGTDKHPLDDQYLFKIYNSLCEACGISPSFSQFNVNLRKSENSDQLLSLILDNAYSLASDISKLRSRLSYNKKGRFDFLSKFEELENQVAHLDQLHTQTRALLVKQSQIISDLRMKAGSASWISWAKNLYTILCSADFDEDVFGDVSGSFSVKKGAVNAMDPDYAVELKLAIEEKAAAVMAKERMRSLRSNS